MVYQEFKQENGQGCLVCLRCFSNFSMLYLYIVVWVPDPNILKLAGTVTEKADQILDSLEKFIPEQWGLPPYASESC